MIVRFKMDRAGIKLKLAEWSKFSTWKNEWNWQRKPAAMRKKQCCITITWLVLINKYTGKEATALTVDQNPEWAI